MIRAVQLSSDKSCHNHGWSRVNQSGWNLICGQAHDRIQRAAINIHDLKKNIDEVKNKTRNLIQVSDSSSRPVL